MDVPPDVVPCQYIVPPVPPEAVIVVLPQNVPAPPTVTAVGAAFTVIVVFADVAEVEVTQPAEVVMIQETN